MREGRGVRSAEGKPGATIQLCCVVLREMAGDGWWDGLSLGNRHDPAALDRGTVGRHPFWVGAPGIFCGTQILGEGSRQLSILYDP